MLLFHFADTFKTKTTPIIANIRVKFESDLLCINMRAFNTPL